MALAVVRSPPEHAGPHRSACRTSGTALHPAREALLSAAVVVPRTDADDLAAGALALRARGEPATAALQR